MKVTYYEYDQYYNAFYRPIRTIENVLKVDFPASAYERRVTVITEQETLAIDIGNIISIEQ